MKGLIFTRLEFICCWKLTLPEGFCDLPNASLGTKNSSVLAIQASYLHFWRNKEQNGWVSCPKTRKKKKDCLWDDESNRVSKLLFLSNVELIGQSRKNRGQRETKGKRCHRVPGSDLDLEVAIAKRQESLQALHQGQLPILTVVLQGARSLRADGELVRIKRGLPVTVTWVSLPGILAEAVHP
jgi:hypothetical protein